MHLKHVPVALSLYSYFYYHGQTQNQYINLSSKAHFLTKLNSTQNSYLLELVSKDFMKTPYSIDEFSGYPLYFSSIVATATFDHYNMSFFGSVFKNYLNPTTPNIPKVELVDHCLERPFILHGLPHLFENKDIPLNIKTINLLPFDQYFNSSLIAYPFKYANSGLSTADLGFVLRKKYCIAAKTDPFFYCSNGDKIPHSKINDNYCDCPNGLDEPGTNACLNNVFYCSVGNTTNDKYSIPSTMVLDSIKDCDDGSDEINEDSFQKNERLDKSSWIFKIAMPI